MIYRVKQFVWAISSIFKDTNDPIVSEYLSPVEVNLFKEMKKSDQAHCIRVAYNMIDYCDSHKECINIKRYMIRLSLLHDIGKSVYRLNAIEKTIMVLLNKIVGEEKLKTIKDSKLIKGYYYHGQKGAQIIKNDGEKYDEKFLYIIENHHNKDKINDSLELCILKYIDDIS